MAAATTLAPLEPAPPFYRLHEHFGVVLGGAQALFTTRRGGHSTGAYRSLNLGLNTADDAHRVQANHEAVAAVAGRGLAPSRQMHGTAIHRCRWPPTAALPEADGQVTAEHGVAPMVLVADCLPIVVASMSAVVVVHAGWRGLAGAIIANGVRALREASIAEDRLEAAIGPGVGGCCYEVGEEVHAAFAARHPGARRGANLDLKAIARAELEQAGVSAVHDLGMCTLCGDPALFFSHRRDGGVTGRQAAVAWLTSSLAGDACHS